MARRQKSRELQEYVVQMYDAYWHTPLVRVGQLEQSWYHGAHFHHWHGILKEYIVQSKVEPSANIKIS